MSAETTPIRKEHRVQVAFSGGGARLAALLPYLTALDELRRGENPALRVDFARVAGTSAGSIAAVVLAAGVSPTELARLVKRSSAFRLSSFWRWPWVLWSAASFLSGGLTRWSALGSRGLQRRLAELLKEAPGYKPSSTSTKVLDGQITLLSDLCVIRTNLQSARSEECWFDKGKPYQLRYFVDRIVDSCAIPFALRAASDRPVYVDGGITRNLPVHVLRGAEREHGLVLAFLFLPNQQKLAAPRTTAGLLLRVLSVAIDASTDAVLEEGSHVEVRVESPGFKHALSFGAARKLLSKKHAPALEAYTKLARASLQNLLMVHEEFHHSERRASSLDKHVRRNVLRRAAGSEGARPFEGVNLVALRYTNISAVEKLQASLQETLGRGGAKPQELDQDARDAFMNPGLAIGAPTIYPFPFFLTALRRDVWGVVPYGLHRALGIVAPRAHGLGALVEPYLYHGEADCMGIAPEAGAQVLDFVLRRVAPETGTGGRLWAHSGTIADEMLPLCMYGADAGGLMPSYVATLRRIPRRGWNIPELIPASVTFHQDGKPQDIMVFDLAERPEIEKEIAKRPDHDELEVLAVHHGLFIPVGVGFSLPAYRYLQVREAKEWKWAADSAYRFLIPVRSAIAEAGIQLTESLAFGIDL